MNLLDQDFVHRRPLLDIVLVGALIGIVESFLPFGHVAVELTAGGTVSTVIAGFTRTETFVHSWKGLFAATAILAYTLRVRSGEVPRIAFPILGLAGLIALFFADIPFASSILLFGAALGTEAVR